MAPLEPDLSNSNLRAYATLGGGLYSSAALTSLVLYSTATAYTSLPPSQGTRFKESHRKNHVLVFAALTVTSLVASLWNKASFLVDGYKTWAYERGESVPGRLWGAGGIYGSEQAEGVQLGRWLHDTGFVKAFWETNVEDSRGFWWSQQVFLGVVAWGVFLNVEGRRRQIPHLWVYALLAQVVGLSFAQNLFYLAILSHPVSTEDSPPKSSTSTSKWFPNATTLHLLTLIPTYTSTFLLPFASNTSSFTLILFLARSLPFLPLLYPYILPSSSRTTTTTTTLTLFKSISYISLLLHVKSTILALTSPLPSSHHHHLLPDLLPDALTPEKYQHHHTPTSAVSHLLAAPSHNTALRSLAHDVLLSTISLVAWSALRGLDPVAMLVAAGVPGFAIKEIPGIEGAEQRVREKEGGGELPNGVSEGDNDNENEHENGESDHDHEPRRSQRKTRGGGRGSRGGRGGGGGGGGRASGRRNSIASTTSTSNAKPKRNTRRTAAAQNENENENENTTPYIPSPPSSENGHDSHSHNVNVAAGTGIATATGTAERWTADDTDTTPNVEAGVLAWGLAAVGGVAVAGAGVWGA